MARRLVSSAESASVFSSSAARTSKSGKTRTPRSTFAPDLSLTVSYVSPTELTEYGNNPRTHSPDQIQNK